MGGCLDGWMDGWMEEDTKKRRNKRGRVKPGVTKVSHDFFLFDRTNPQLAGKFVTFHKESGNDLNHVTRRRVTVHLSYSFLFPFLYLFLFFF